MEDFGDRLRKQRDSLGLNQRNFAARMKVGKTQIHRWETGDGKEFLSRVAALAHELAVRPGWLAFGEGDPPAVGAFARDFIADLRALLDKAGDDLAALTLPTERLRRRSQGGQGEPTGAQDRATAGELANVDQTAIEAPPLTLPPVHPIIREEDLPPLTRGVAQDFLHVAAGHPLIDIESDAEFAENGKRYVVVRVHGTSMAGPTAKTGIPDKSRVVLEMLPDPGAIIEPADGELLSRQGIVDGAIYLVDIEKGPMRGLTLKRVEVGERSVILTADNPAGWDGRRCMWIERGDKATIKARFRGIFKARRGRK